MTLAPLPQAQPGHLYAVGTGPGDPGLVTRTAAALITSADVIAYHQARADRPSVARAIVAELIDEAASHHRVIEEPLVYPVTTGEADHPGGYYGAMEEFYDACAARLGEHLRAGRSVVVLGEGDPMFYGSPMYVLDLLRAGHPVEVVPGVTSPSAASAALATGLCRHEDVLTVLPGTLPVTELARRLSDCDAAVVMKLGRTFTNVREALRQAGLLERAVLVERASTAQQRVTPVADVDPEQVPYLSLVLVPGRDRRADAAGRAGAPTHPVEVDRAAVASSPSSDTAGEAMAAPGTVHVVGLGPGPDRWTTPEATEVLGRVDHVIGYTPYVDRVPQREGLTRHASGNTVEVDRGRLALDLALAGDEVAVVSGGDAGVFGMASAVFEAAEADERYAAVPIHVVPGVTAAHAAAALAGALLGGDHALVSLSDRLKPWEVVVDRLVAAARADLAIALYNPRSRTRPDQLGLAQQALLEVVPGDRVVVVARHVGRAQESLHVTTLAGLDPDTVDMGCLVVIGSSSTRVRPDGRVWTPRYVTDAPAEQTGPAPG